MITKEFATPENALAALDKIWKYLEDFTMGKSGPIQAADSWYAFEQAEETIRQVLKNEIKRRNTDYQRTTNE